MTAAAPAISNAVLLEKLTGIADSLARLDRQLGAVVCRIDAMEQRLQGLEKTDLSSGLTNQAKIEALHRRQDELALTVKAHEDKLEQLRTAVMELAQTNRILKWILGVFTVGLGALATSWALKLVG